MMYECNGVEGAAVSVGVSQTDSSSSHCTIHNIRYTPLKRIETMPPPLEYDPVKCNGCGGVLNPHW